MSLRESLALLGFQLGEAFEVSGINKSHECEIKSRRFPVAANGLPVEGSFDSTVLEWIGEERGLYVCPNPVIIGPAFGRSKDSEVTSCRWLFIDIDAHDVDGGGLYSAEQVTLRIKAFLEGEFGTKLSLIKTGGGFHLWLRHGDGPNIKAYRNTLLKILDARFSSIPTYNVDITTGNPSKLMRLPGSRNFSRQSDCKIVDQAQQVKVVDYEILGAWVDKHKYDIKPKKTVKPKGPIARQATVPYGSMDVFDALNIEIAVNILNNHGLEWREVAQGCAKGVCPARGQKCNNSTGAFMYEHEGNGVGKIVCSHKKSCGQVFSLWDVLMKSHGNDKRLAMEDLKNSVGVPDFAEYAPRPLLSIGKPQNVGLSSIASVINGGGHEHGLANMANSALASTVSPINLNLELQDEISFKPIKTREVIAITANISDMIAAVEAHLGRSGLYSFEGIVGIPDDRAVLPFVNLNPASVCHFISEVCDFKKPDKGGWVPCSIPARIGEVIENKGSKEIRRIENFFKTPLVDCNGDIFMKTGYHEGSLGYVTDNEVTQQCLGVIKSNKNGGLITRADAVEACDGFFELLKDFPFKDSSGICGVIAWIVSCVGYRSLRGPTPIFLFTSNTPGSGKNALVETGSLIATGMNASSLSWGVTPDELSKAFLSASLVNKPILFDEVVRAESDFVQKAATSRWFTGRLLGHNKEAQTIRPPIAIAGNNVWVVGDIYRRIVRVTLNTQLENPGSRNDFAIKDYLNHVLTNRVKYLVAAMAILSYCLNPKPTKINPLPLGAFGSFESFWSTIGHGLLDLGVGNLGENLIRIEEEGSEYNDLSDALRSVRRNMPGSWTCGQIKMAAEKNEELGEALYILCGKDWRKLTTKAIGMLLRHRLNRVSGGHKLIRTHDNSTNMAIYSAEYVDDK